MCTNVKTRAVASIPCEGKALIEGNYVKCFPCRDDLAIGLDGNCRGSVIITKEVSGNLSGRAESEIRTAVGVVKRVRQKSTFLGSISSPVLQAAGIKRKARENGFHAFRHAAGSILYEITRDIELVKRFPRHSRISTTSDIYVHPLGLTNEATEAMANVFLAVEEAKGVQ